MIFSKSRLFPNILYQQQRFHWTFPAILADKSWLNLLSASSTVYFVWHFHIYFVYVLFGANTKQHLHLIAQSALGAFTCDCTAMNLYCYWFGRRSAPLSAALAAVVSSNLAAVGCRLGAIALRSSHSQWARCLWCEFMRCLDASSTIDDKYVHPTTFIVVLLTVTMGILMSPKNNIFYKEDLTKNVSVTI